MKSLLNSRSTSRRGSPQLWFSPTAWAKLLFLRDRGTSEVGGFGVARHDDLLYVEDIQTVQQVCSVVTVQFDDDAVARFFDAQVDAGRQPVQFARIWLHTHPEISAQPSLTDEETFDRVFGRTDWAVMFILSKTEEVYCRLRFNVGPGGEMEIPVSVDYRHEFAGSDFTAWEAEYQANVRVRAERPKQRKAKDPHQDVIEPRPEPAAEIQPPDRTDVQLREHLQRHWGMSSEDIDGQLELGWSLEDLFEFCRRDGELWPDALEDPRTEALFPA